jgi:hypothetical protein
VDEAGDQRNADHEWQEPGRDPLREPLPTARACGGRDRVDESLERAGAGRGRDLDVEPAVEVRRAAVDRVAGPFLRRHALAGDRSLVDRRGAGHDRAVGGHVLARQDSQPVADLHGGEVHLPLAAGCEQPHAVGQEAAELPQGRRRAPIAAGHPPAAERHRHQHHAGDLEVDVPAAGPRGPGR